MNTLTLAGAASVVAANYDADALTLFAAMTTAPDTARKNLMNTVFVDLKAAGIYSKLDHLALINSDSQGSLLNWKNPTKVYTINGTVTFTSDRGFTGDGTTGYISYPEVLNAAGNVYAQNNAHAGVWCNQDSGSGGGLPHFGDFGSPSPRLIIQAGRSSADAFRMNDATTSAVGTSQSTRVGYRVVSRSVSTDKDFYRNGSLVATVSVASVGVANVAPSILRQLTSYAPDRICAWHSGSSLTATDVSNLNSILGAYLSGIGA